jgi:hypothetical protein
MRSHEAEGPQHFDVAFRGYRRGPVDQYVARLHEWLIDSEARAENAVQAATAAVGERVTQVLRAALEAGDETRKVAVADAATTVSDAETRAAEVIRNAERNAAQLRKRAEAIVREAEAEKATAIKNAKLEADKAMEDARREIAGLQRTIDELEARKANAVDDLGRLQRYLAGTPDVSPLDAVADSAEPGPGPTTPPMTAGTAGGMTAAPDVPGGPEVKKDAVFTNGGRPSA